ncbi:M14 family metallopeptidase [Piscinibacter sp. XHJ-5]|uniref:M14 family metallopeptidase n=1 Tax=Piscinibacter sp. XHJ-5 TaxID=3037797 RepID=UPI0024535C1B|nr:M14 family metallopeptidase [Piscinibacter sp. XHJ-5]
MTVSMSFPRSAGAPLALLLAGLVACTTPAPAPPQPSARGVFPPVPAKPPASAPAAPRAPAVEAPVPVAPKAAASAASGPYPAAVAARFPDPPVSYRTPAFQPGRTAFTTNEEVQAVLRGLAQEGRAGGTTARLLLLGSSQTGVPLQALLFTRQADAEAAALLRSGRPTVLLVGQQHGDEPAGSEALLAIAQELAGGRLEPLLDRLNVIVLPRANPDGARDMRRVTAGGIDANRDHLLLKTPEAQAQAQLVREYRPAVVVDAHEYTVAGRYLEKFGALQRVDAMVQYATIANLPPLVTRAAEEWFRQPLVARLKAEGLSTEWYYTTSADDLADKKVSMGGVQPDNGRNVNGLRNAVSFLIETRGVGIGRLHFLRRVHTHVTAIASILQSAADRSDDILKLRQFVDNEVSASACQGELVVEAAPTPSEYVLPMLDPQTGADRPVPVAWDSSLALRATKVRPRPCGYWLANSQSDAVRRLRALGVNVQQLAQDGDLRAEAYRETAREEGVRSDVRGSIADMGGIVKVKVETVPALIDVKAGGYYVPLDQPLANLIGAALEPDTQSSYLSHRIVDSVDDVARVMSPPAVKLTPVP